MKKTTASLKTKKEKSKENPNTNKKLQDTKQNQQCINHKCLSFYRSNNLLLMVLSKSKVGKFIMVTILLLIIDIASKYFFYNLQMGKELSMIQPSFNFGIARSINLPLIVTIIISLISLVTFFIIYFRGYINIIIAGFLIAGTLGNLRDRLLFGGVRDFINIQIYNFPIFNIADIFLNIGVILFIVKEIWS